MTGWLETRDRDRTGLFILRDRVMSTSTADEQLDAEVIELEPTMHLTAEPWAIQGRIIRIRSLMR